MVPYAIRRFLVVGLIAGLAGVDVATADEPSPPVAGARVRVTAPTISGKRLVGTIGGLDDATLTLHPQGAKDLLKVPRGAITRIEVSRHRSRRGKGAGIGALVGIGAAVVIGVAAGDDCNFPPARPEDLDLVERLNRNLCFGKGETAILSALLTVPVGMLVGLGVAPGEKWQATSPDRLRVGLAPVRGGGVRAAVSVRF